MKRNQHFKALVASHKRCPFHPVSGGERKAWERNDQIPAQQQVYVSCGEWEKQQQTASFFLKR